MYFMDFYWLVNDHTEIWSLQLNNTGILSSCSRVGITGQFRLYRNMSVGMDHSDFTEKCPYSWTIWTLLKCVIMAGPFGLYRNVPVWRGHFDFTKTFQYRLSI